MYFLKGPFVTQPPPLPDGRKIVPAPAKLPLCARKSPLPLREVSEPSNTGERDSLAAFVPQFQYYEPSLARERLNSTKGLLVGILDTHTRFLKLSHTGTQSIYASLRSFQYHGSLKCN